LERNGFASASAGHTNLKHEVVRAVQSRDRGKNEGVADGNEPSGVVTCERNTNQTIPKTMMARPVPITKSTNTDGPGSACRASVGVLTI
jgi:hypothetical protein